MSTKRKHEPADQPLMNGKKHTLNGANGVEKSHLVMDNASSLAPIGMPVTHTAFDTSANSSVRMRECPVAHNDNPP
jgi:hypothetical protein